MITVERPLHAALLFHVLSHLDLGRDAASLYDPRRPKPPWLEPLRAAYRADPQRLRVHFLAHWTADLATLDAALGPGKLADALRVALRAERAAVEAALARDDAAARRARFEAEVAPALTRCRDALHAGAAPPLRVLDVPALGPHGRGLGLPRERVVAVSLAPPSDHVFCQVLHEEVHPITDPRVQAAWRGERTRDTRAGSAGHALHAALEAAALDEGADVIAACAPEFVEAYARWCARFEARPGPAAGGAARAAAILGAHAALPWVAALLWHPAAGAVAAGLASALWTRRFARRIAQPRARAAGHVTLLLMLLAHVLRLG